MATLTKGKTFTNGELVTPQKLHELVDLGSVSGIVNADISNTAAIALSKLATGALPTGITVASANVDGLQTALDGKQAAGSYVTNGGSVSSIQRVTSMPASPAANTLYIVIP